MMRPETTGPPAATAVMVTVADADVSVAVKEAVVVVPKIGVPGEIACDALIVQ